jgi:hypothetical protein
VQATAWVVYRRFQSSVYRGSVVTSQEGESSTPLVVSILCLSRKCCDGVWRIAEGGFQMFQSSVYRGSVVTLPLWKPCEATAYEAIYVDSPSKP